MTIALARITAHSAPSGPAPSYPHKAGPARLARVGQPIGPRITPYLLRPGVRGMSLSSLPGRRPALIGPHPHRNRHTNPY